MGFAGYDNRMTDGRSFTEFGKEMRRNVAGAELPGELYLPMRCSMMLRGLALLFRLHVSPASLWADTARRLLDEEQREF